MYLHYDTETEGLNVQGVPSDDPRQPHLVSISAVLDDQHGNEIGKYSTLIKPDGWTIDERLEVENPEKPGTMIKSAFSIHGITNARALAEGIDLDVAMREVAALTEKADILSAFNHFFDFKFLKISCAQMRDKAEGERIRVMLETKSAICTMDASRKELKAGRFIKLAVAHQQLLGETFDKGHESMADTQAHRRIFYHLKSMGVLGEPKPLTRKTYSTPPPSRETKAKGEIVEAAVEQAAVAPLRKRPPPI